MDSEVAVGVSEKIRIFISMLVYNGGLSCILVMY